MKAEKEYVIWGVRPGHTEEEMLISHASGNPITKKSQIEKYIPWLLHNHNCNNLRIQVI